MVPGPPLNTGIARLRHLQPDRCIRQIIVDCRDFSVDISEKPFAVAVRPLRAAPCSGSRRHRRSVRRRRSSCQSSSPFQSSGDMQHLVRPIFEPLVQARQDSSTIAAQLELVALCQSAICAPVDPRGRQRAHLWRCRLVPGWTPTHQVGPNGLSCHQGDARRSVVCVQPVASALLANDREEV